tara:strand:- start:70 stop:525 length:456 start_codon:yes stop_codon:yes gene_type:complete
MRLDKLAYLGLSVFTLVVIIIVIVLGNYGVNISSDRNFLAFFKWYIFLFVFNLLNIFVTLVFHYIMADVQGVQGLKGFTGDKGLPGEAAKCFCDDDRMSGGPDTTMADIDLTSDIKTRMVTDLEDQPVGTLIYHDSEPPATEALNVGRVIM